MSIRTWEGSRSLGSLAGRIVSDWKKAAWSLKEVAEDSRDGDTTLFSGHIDDGKENVIETVNKNTDIYLSVCTYHMVTEVVADYHVKAVKSRGDFNFAKSYEVYVLISIIL